jgi:putative intracellular protease/amidase
MRTSLSAQSSWQLERDEKALWPKPIATPPRLHEHLPAMAHILFPLPRRDFDPSEAAVSWRVLSGLGHRISFSTPDGAVAECDPIMISGRGLDPWSAIPGLGRLPVIGLLLRANGDARRAYEQMCRDPSYLAPVAWNTLAHDHYDAIVLPGGHRARGMRAYLESPVLQALVAGFFAADKPVAAICHGVVLAARSKSKDGRSVLYGRKTTALTWKQERTASAFAHVGRFWDRNYYRTYPEQPGQPAGFLSVEHEVTRALARPEDFLDVPARDPLHRRKTLGLWRDSTADATPAWVVVDGKYVSARWPGDAHTFAKAFGDVLAEQA